MYTKEFVDVNENLRRFVGFFSNRTVLSGNSDFLLQRSPKTDRWRKLCREFQYDRRAEIQIGLQQRKK
jgi:hypothetical protein